MGESSLSVDTTLSRIQFGVSNIPILALVNKTSPPFILYIYIYVSSTYIFIYMYVCICRISLRFSSANVIDEIEEIGNCLEDNGISLYR